jgi:CubicO group peptidase (beta-lactamase class C family)
MLRLLVILALSGCSTLPKRPDPSVKEALLEARLPGIGVRVESQGKVLLNEAQGLRSLQHLPPATTEDRWHLGSDTKAMTAFLIALAIQDRRMDWESEVIPLLGLEREFKAHPDNQKLTLADLLVHQSGLQDTHDLQSGNLWLKLAQSKLPVLAQRIEITRATLAAPSKKSRAFSYANINYIVLGTLLEATYTTAWENLMRERIFRPLGMASCGFGVAGTPGEKTPSQPWPHIMEKDQLVGAAPEHKLDNPPLLGPAGTVHCSLADWSKFIHELINAAQGRGKLLRKRELAQHLLTPASGTYTYGAWISGQEGKITTFAHDGSNTFNYAKAWFAPKSRSIVLIATNAVTPKTKPALRQLQDVLIERTR